jgi:hypothetical protein
VIRVVDHRTPEEVLDEIEDDLRRDREIWDRIERDVRSLYPSERKKSTVPWYGILILALALAVVSFGVGWTFAPSDTETAAGSQPATFVQERESFAMP